MRDTIGGRLKYIRKQAKLSQQQIADKLGLKSGQSVYDYESDTSEPSISSLKKLVELSGKSIEWLVYGKENYDLSIPTVLRVKETEALYSKSQELSTEEEEIINLLRAKPELIPLILELIKTRIKQDQLLKQLGAI